MRAAQQKLSQDGFYSGKVDGNMNQGTRSAIRQYQKANNLQETGRLDRETAQKMGLATGNGNGNWKNESPLEQLGKGVAEGAKTPENNNNNNPHRNH